MIYLLRMGRGRVLFAIIVLLAICAAYILTTQSPAPLSAPTTSPSFAALTEPALAAPSEELIGTANCRYGTSADNNEAPWLPTVKAGWYINFGTGSSTVPGTEFVQFVNIHQNKNGNVYLPSFTVNPALTDTQLGAIIAANPGSLWVIGNEVDRIGQGETYPDIYAIAYHDVYHYIKQRDPSATIGNAGLVQASPSRLEYLNLAWDAYLDTFGTPMPVDVWTFHIYVLPEVQTDGVTPNGIANVPLGVNEPPNPPFSDWRRESGGSAAVCSLDEVYCFAEHTDMNTFQGQVTAMRQWMHARGQKEKPLVLTEFSVLYPYEVDPGGTCFLQDEFGNCFTPTRVGDFMQAAYNYLENNTNPNLGYTADNNRLVQQWLWYSMYSTGPGSVSNLIKSDFASYPAGSVNALTPIGQKFRTYVSALPLGVNLFPYHYTFTQINNDTIDIHVQVMNNGNTEVNGSFTVGLYANPSHTLLIDSVTIPNVNGCARDKITATLRWPGLSAETRPFYIKVDATNQVPETNEQDNTIAGYIFLDPDLTYMPQVTRR